MRGIGGLIASQRSAAGGALAWIARPNARYTSAPRTSHALTSCGSAPGPPPPHLHTRRRTVDARGGRPRSRASIEHFAPALGGRSRTSVVSPTRRCSRARRAPRRHRHLRAASPRRAGCSRGRLDPVTLDRPAASASMPLVVVRAYESAAAQRVAIAHSNTAQPSCGAWLAPSGRCLSLRLRHQANAS